MYNTSTDYNRLWELIQPTEEERKSFIKTGSMPVSCVLYRISCLSSAAWYLCRKVSPNQSKEGFTADCKRYGYEFIDPASQQKTPAELAAGEMAEVLQWALDAMPQSSFHAEYVHHFCVALAEKAEEILKKARGEE